MGKLKFGAWVATYAWGDGGDRDNRRRIHESIAKGEEHGIDVWVIDHLLSAPGLYGNAWLEPLSVLSYAAAITSRVKLATGILVLPVRQPVVLAKEISTLCHLSDNRYVFGVGPGWYAREYEVTGSRIEERGRRTDEIIEAVTLLLTKPSASYRGRYYQFSDVTIDPRPAPRADTGDVGVWRLAAARSRRARRAGHREDGHGPHREGGTLAVPLLGHAGVGQARLGRIAGARPRRRPRPEGAHLRPLQLHPPGGDRGSRPPARGIEGAVPA